MTSLLIPKRLLAIATVALAATVLVPASAGATEPDELPPMLPGAPDILVGKSLTRPDLPRSELNGRIYTLHWMAPYVCDWHPLDPEAPWNQGPIRWIFKGPYECGEVDGYIVQAKPMHCWGNAKGRTVRVSADKTFRKFKLSKNCGSYIFRVRAYNDAGKGERASIHVFLGHGVGQR